MSPLGDPQPRDIEGAVEMINAKLAVARDLREGLAAILGLQYTATNDQIFTAIRILKTNHRLPRQDDVARIEELEREFTRLDAEHARLVRHLRAKGVLE
ncbi:MAG TPA: hypothetical protein VH084_28305 [Mycobacterium sp.]|jgi:hypothetical protein|nr:hypothetical protein [Mycobacterium sp.]